MSLVPCSSTIATYFKTVLGDLEGYIPLRAFSERHDAPQHILQTMWIKNDETAVVQAIKFANTVHGHHYGFYVIPGVVAAPGQAKAQHVIAMQTLVVDLDVGPIQEKYQHLAHLLGTPSLTVESGGITVAGEAKLHVYWQLSEPVSGADLEKLAKLRHTLALKIGGDTSFQSLHQPIRVAGSLHHKSESARSVHIREATALIYHLDDLVERIDEMYPFDTHSGDVPALIKPNNLLDCNSVKTAPKLDQVRTTVVHAGGTDDWTRFEGISRVIGYWIRRYHDGMIRDVDAWAEILAYNTACVIPPWPEERLQRETQRLWRKHIEKNGSPKPMVQPVCDTEPSMNSDFMDYLLDLDLPEQPALIEPHILPPGEIMVFAGAAKVGKSDFLFSLFAHMAAGRPFLNFIPSRPLKIFYLQAEINHYYVHKRIQQLGLSEPIKQALKNNCLISYDVRMTLDDKGLAYTVAHVREKFGDQLPDIIAIDPIRNLFNGGPKGDHNENNNEAMLFFLQQRIQTLQRAINPKAGVILVHHNRKLSKKVFEEDPFNALCGASALRAFFSTGIILYRPDESQTTRQLFFELRNGPAIETKTIDKVDNQWVELDSTSARLLNQHYGAKLDAERVRKREVIESFIYEAAKKGEVYTMAQFAESFENHHGLGSRDAIHKRMNTDATKGYIKFFKNAEDYRLKSPERSKFGYMCVEGMVLGKGEAAQAVYPTHYKDKTNGLPLEVEDPKVWVFHDEPLKVGCG